MIKTPVLCAALVAVLSFSALAEGARGIYVRADGGVTMPKTNQLQFNSAGMGGVGIGYHFNDVLKVDLNWQCRNIKATNSRSIKKIKNSGFMLNGYLNLSDSEDWLIPYLMAGVGYGKNKIKTFSSSSSVGGLAIEQLGGKKGNVMWNVGVGLDVEIVRNLRLDLAYRYVNLGKAIGKYTIFGLPAFNNVKAIKSNEVTLGLIYNF